MFLSRYKWIVLCVVLILVLVPPALNKAGLLPTINLLTKTSPTPTPKIVDLCAPFTADKGKTSCKEAEKIALIKYPGDIKYIKSETATISAGILPNTTNTKKDVWKLGINPKEPITIGDREFNHIELYIVKENGELQTHLLMQSRL